MDEDATMTKWTKELLIEKLNTSDVMVERSLLVVYANQKADEQNNEATSHDNGKGFNGSDAFIMTKFAKWIIEGSKKGYPEGKRLSPKQREITRKKLKKYTKQLLAAVKTPT